MLQFTQEALKLHETILKLKKSAKELVEMMKEMKHNQETENYYDDVDYTLPKLTKEEEEQILKETLKMIQEIR